MQLKLFQRIFQYQLRFLMEDFSMQDIFYMMLKFSFMLSYAISFSTNYFLHRHMIQLHFDFFDTNI